ncbi:MAG: GAF domain-containing protein, partial [Anaerolineae bacterium]|nr:GAF domain-containing protein [Anaerolineae bacterium]
QRAAELETVAEVGAQTTSILEVEHLLQTVSDMAKENFDLYHAHIYLLNDIDNRLEIAAGAGDAGRMMASVGHNIPLGQENSLVARAARTGQSVIANDVTVAPDFLPNPLLPNTKSEMAVPMIVGNRVIGVLDVQSDEFDHFTDETARVQSILAAQLASAVQNARLFGEVQVEVERRALLYALGQRLSETLDPRIIAQVAANGLSAMINIPEIVVFHYDYKSNSLEALAGYGSIGEQMAGVTLIPDAAPPIARMLRTAETDIQPDLANTGPEHDFVREIGLSAAMIAPILAGGEIIGAFLLGDTAGPRAFPTDQVQVVQSLAFQVGTTLQNAYLYIEQVQTAEQLREVDRLKSEFLASMSHELRTPLNSIIGYSEVLLDGLDGELTGEMDEDVNAIYGSGKHLLNMINDILDLAKIEANQMDLGKESIDLKPFVDDLVTASRVLLKDKPVDLIIDINSDLPHVFADPLRLRQIISNLLTNAIKFTDKGSITVRAEHYALNPGLLQVSVIDTGIGISQDNQTKVFERFRQVDQSVTRRVGGSGLGLAITRQLVELHGGTIWVKSRLGIGSTFTFTVPTVNAEVV